MILSKIPDTLFYPKVDPAGVNVTVNRFIMDDSLVNKVMR